MTVPRKMPSSIANATIMSFDGYNEVLQEQQKKDNDLQSVKERLYRIENVLVAIQPLLKC